MGREALHQLADEGVALVQRGDVESVRRVRQRPRLGQRGDRRGRATGVAAGGAGARRPKAK